jgi:hypothetical protein
MEISVDSFESARAGQNFQVPDNFVLNWWGRLLVCLGHTTCQAGGMSQTQTVATVESIFHH